MATAYSTATRDLDKLVNMKRFAWAMVLLATCGCTAPPYKVETVTGVVYAGDQTTAERVALALDFAPAVRRRLESTREDRPVVFALDVSEEELGALAKCNEHRIRLSREALQTLDFVVAHELAHWYMRGSPYYPIPYFLEEGLADYIALELNGGEESLEARDREVEQIDDFVFQAGHFYGGPQAVQMLPPGEKLRLLYFGYAVVRRLGLAKLRELVAAEAYPLDYLEASQFGVTRSQPVFPSRVPVND